MLWPYLDFAFVVSGVLSRESVDEMYFVLDVDISEQGTALNCCVYIDDDISESLSVPVIKDWVEWSCEQMISQRLPFYVKELCFGVRVRHGMLLFCLAGAVHGDGHLHNSIPVH